MISERVDYSTGDVVRKDDTVRKLGSLINSAVERLEWGSTAAASVIILGLMFLVVTDVLGRKLFRSPLHGSTEMAEVTLVFIVYLSIAYVQRFKGHIKIEMVTGHLTKRAQLLLDLVGFIFALVICVLITWQCSFFAWKSFVQKDYTMGIVRVPVWPAKVVVAFGFGLLCVQLVLDIQEGFKELFKRND